MGKVTTKKQMTGRDRHWQARKTTNRQFAQSDEAFNVNCDAAGVKPTRRQASKYRRGMGKAFNN